MLELWQTEWCPASRRVRQRLTELAVDHLARQVPVEREERIALRTATGGDTIPALVPESGAPIPGENEILAYLDARFEPTAGANAHREKAAKARRRDLEEACKCSLPATP